MKTYTGTSGFSYKEWKGRFYPERLPANKMLSYYATRLSAVEINNTFYRLPRAEVLEKWRATAGPDFRFAIKASRRITHFARLGERSFEPAGHLFDTLSVLGDALGAVLFQLPPNFKADAGLLARLLEVVPEGCRAAFEFRNDSWHTEEVHELLGGRGAALVRSDMDGSDAEAPLVATTNWGYLRLRREAYSDAELDSWAKRIRATNWERIFVFFKHEDGATGPALAESFRRSLAGLSGSG